MYLQDNFMRILHVWRLDRKFKNIYDFMQCPRILSSRCNGLEHRLCYVPDATYCEAHSMYLENKEYIYILRLVFDRCYDHAECVTWCGFTPPCRGSPDSKTGDGLFPHALEFLKGCQLIDWRDSLNFYWGRSRHLLISSNKSNQSYQTNASAFQKH